MTFFSAIGGLSAVGILVLFVSLLVAFGFEFVNGFHDTANAVATVIYTHSLKANYAVMWSGLWNFLGVIHATATGLAVAFSIVHLLPVDLLVNLGSTSGILMVLSLLISAIIWNFGTWYLGLPASSSHTLIGSVLGVGLASSFFTGAPIGSGVNWGKAEQVMLSLLISPVIGFVLAAIVFLIAKATIKNKELFEAPDGEKAPPWYIRGVLILTCTGVSFAHGSNDGQKGIGLIMLILIGLLPAAYALNPDLDGKALATFVAAADDTVGVVLKTHLGIDEGQALSAGVADPANDPEWKDVKMTKDPIPPTAPAIFAHLNLVRSTIENKSSLSEIPASERWELRTEVLQLRQAMADYVVLHKKQLTADDTAKFDTCQAQALKLTEFAPLWVPLGVAIALGVGTMIGWKRIVVTVGEKIGKTHLTYAQGASAELVAMVTIGAADTLGLPVSTTHVLSSGVAGTMAASRSGLQFATVRNIAAAWVLTLPVSMALSAGLYTVSTTIAGRPNAPTTAAVRTVSASLAGSALASVGLVTHTTH